MFSLWLENRRGDSIELTHNNNYMITDIDGLYPPSASIVTSEVSLYDGSKFNTSKVDERQIDISIAITHNAEENRIALYKVIKSKQYIKMSYKNGSRDVYIEGYVSDMNIDYFANPQTVSISILCPEPYFKEAQEIVNGINATVNNFHFPCSITAEDKKPFSYYEEKLEVNITNEGDIESGMTIEIHASGQVDNPAILNRETREYFRLATSLQQGDTLYINTQKGKKSVQVFRDGEYVNLFNYVAEGSTWLQLQPGDNLFTYEADNESVVYMDINFVHEQLYEGV